MEKISLDQFKGCMAGLLVGDCLGFPYENESSRNYPLSQIRLDLENIKKGVLGSWMLTQTGRKQYTDDTSMSISVSKFLLDSPPDNFDYRDLARRFCDFYANEPLARSYGSNVGTVFRKLKSTNFEDPFKPAAEQFNGEGSQGNGSGMRVAPIALYTIQDPDLRRLVEITLNVSRITHTHPIGVVGGIFQALAVRQGMLFGAREAALPEPTALEILNSFEKKFLSVVKSKQFPQIENGWKIYASKIKCIRKFIEMGGSGWSLDDVKNELGVAVLAADSIPTGLFCFLAGFENPLNSKADNQFERTIELALALGGDTDTIGSMAGAICGAYVGFDGISENFIKNCEDFEGLLELAVSLHRRGENCEKN